MPKTAGEDIGVARPGLGAKQAQPTLEFAEGLTPVATIAVRLVTQVPLWRPAMMRLVPGRSPAAGWRLTNCDRAARRAERSAREFFNDRA